MNILIFLKKLNKYKNKRWLQEKIMLLENYVNLKEVYKNHTYIMKKKKKEKKRTEKRKRGEVWKFYPRRRHI